MSEKAGSGGLYGMPWFHRNIGRMETEKLLMESREDGAFLIRESDTVKGAYVLSTIYQQRIHHYRILRNEEGLLSIQAQQGVQRKQFAELVDLVQYYGQPKRGLVCGLSLPISQQKEEEEPPEPEEESGDDEPVEASREKNIISSFLLANLSTVDVSKVDSSFLEQLRLYLNGDVSRDVESMATPAPQVTHLKELFSKDCELLHRQLDKMMLQVDLVQTLFERAGGAKSAGQRGASAKQRRSKVGDEDYESLGHKLSECSESVRNLETTAFQMLRELSVSLSGRPAHGGSFIQHDRSSSIVKKTQEVEEEFTFDVKIDQGLSGKKSCTIIVSLKDGTLRFCKAGDINGTKFGHHQLLQLVKSRSKEQRLGILFEGQNRKDYTFNSMQSREHFCQVVQLVRNRMIGDQDQDSITVFVGTWNMGDAAPPNDITSWFSSQGLGKTLPTALAHAHDIYALGMQECSLSDKEWTAKVKSTLKSLYNIEYEKVTGQSLWGIRIVLFVKPEHSKKITHLQCTQVRTGIGNVAGNKGAVGISFYFGSLSLCFVSSHLTSGIEKCHRRNQNYSDILKGMGPLKHKRLSQFDLTTNFHHLFFFGDLNYRVDLGAPQIVEYAKKADHDSIYKEDQLQKDKEKKKIFVGFEEEPIMFPPTYRFAKGRRSLDDYVWVKQKRSGIRINVPSYCDRVLWRSYPGTNISNSSYGCTTDIMTSDHSPVFATFQIGGVKQYASEAATPAALPNGTNCFIIVDSCKAKIQTSSKTSFYIEFYSTCFEGLVKSVPNNDWITTMGDESYVKPVWCGRDYIAKIKPIVTEQEYMVQQHLLVLLKSVESDEPYAECCISLRNLIGPTPVCIQSELIHQGLSVGDVEVYMHVTLDQYKKEPEEQLYSNFITAEQEIESSLDMRRRTRSNASSLSNGNTWSSIEHRPMMPLPRTSSHSSSDRFNTGRRSFDESETPPPPIPRRKDPQPGPRPSTPSSYTAPRPVLPARRSESMGLNRSRPDVVTKSEKQPDRQSGSGSPPLARTRNASEGPPIPIKRKNPPRTGSTSSACSTTSEPLPPLPAKDSPPISAKDTRPLSMKGSISEIPSLPAKGDIRPLPANRRSNSDAPSLPAKRDARTLPSKVGSVSDVPPAVPRHRNTELPPLPPKSPEPPPPSKQPTAPLRQPPTAKPRPPSTVEKLLQVHGLQHFTELLIANGYDDIHFITEISEDELHEIGITQASDRSKLLKIFTDYGQRH